MKKIIYLLLVVFGMNAMQTLNAQGLYPIVGYYNSQCAGESVAVWFMNGPPVITGVFTWSKVGGGNLPQYWSSDPQTGSVNCGDFQTINNGDYIVRFISNGNIMDSAIVNLFVNPNPNPWFTIDYKCNSTKVMPTGADYYKRLDEYGDFTVPFDSLYLSGINNMLNFFGFRAFNNAGCYTDVYVGHVRIIQLTLWAEPTKWKIGPGQSTTINSYSNYPVVTSKTKWFKNGLLYAQGVDSIVTSDTGLYRVQMRADASSGGCIKSKGIRIKAKPVSGSRIGENNSEFESIEGKESILDLQIFPNPATDQIQIAGYDQDISIIDIHGRIVNNYKVDTFYGNSEPQTFDISHLVNGIYLVRSGEQTEKLIIQR